MTSERSIRYIRKASGKKEREREWPIEEECIHGLIITDP
jgi:hypothetical protein